LTLLQPVFRLSVLCKETLPTAPLSMEKRIN